MTREQVNSIWRFRDAFEYSARHGLGLFAANGIFYLVPADVREGFEGGLLDHEALAEYRVQLPDTEGLTQ